MTREVPLLLISTTHLILPLSLAFFLLPASRIATNDVGRVLPNNDDNKKYVTNNPLLFYWTLKLDLRPRVYLKRYVIFLPFEYGRTPYSGN